MTNALPPAPEGAFHRHDFVELQVVFLGTGRIQAPGRSEYFQPGTFSLTGPDRPHTWGPLRPPMALLIVWLVPDGRRDESFGTEEEIGDAGLLLTGNERLVFPLPAFAAAALDAMLELLPDRTAETQAVIRQMFRAFFYSLLHVLRPPGGKMSGRRPVAGISRLTDRLFLSRVDEYLQNNLHRNLSLEEIAAHFGISVRTLGRRYLRSKGSTVWNTVSRMRMDKARTLLWNTPLSVAEIAGRCGYADGHYFSNCFRKHFGYPPGRVRRAAREAAPEEL